MRSNPAWCQPSPLFPKESEKIRTSDTTVPGHKVSEILNLECPLKTTGKETAERRNQRSKRGHSKNVKLHGLNPDGLAENRLQKEGKSIFMLEKYWIRVTFEAGECICT
jgi:hypothetical protein